MSNTLFNGLLGFEYSNDLVLRRDSDGHYVITGSDMIIGQRDGYFQVGDTCTVDISLEWLSATIYGKKVQALGSSSGISFVGDLVHSLGPDEQRFTVETALEILGVPRLYKNKVYFIGRSPVSYDLRLSIVAGELYTFEWNLSDNSLLIVDPEDFEFTITLSNCIDSIPEETKTVENNELAHKICRSYMYDVESRSYCNASFVESVRM